MPLQTRHPHGAQGARVQTVDAEEIPATHELGVLVKGVGNREPLGTGRDLDDSYITIRSSGRTGSQLTVRDSILVRGYMGVLRENNGSGQVTLYNNALSLNSVSYQGVSPGAYSFYTDPPFASYEDFNLTEDSTCRRMASDGTDLGAHASKSPALAWVELAPGSLTAEAGARVSISARAYDAQNVLLPGIHFTWSARPEVGTLLDEGLLNISCELGTVPSAVTVTTTTGLSASADITIVVGKAVQLRLTPGKVTLPAGGSQSFTASVTDVCGHTHQDPITWSTAQRAGTITSAGDYTAPCTPAPTTARSPPARVTSRGPPRCPSPWARWPG
jgi:hypothetical protein